jgi:hypothetical protein
VFCHEDIFTPFLKRTHKQRSHARPFIFNVHFSADIGIALFGFQALSGINSVIFYSTTVFAFAGVDDALLSSLLVGAVNLVATIVAFFLIDRLGRKTLLLIGSSIQVVTLSVAAVVLLTMNSNAKLQGIVAVVATLVYICGFAIGFGAVSWTVLTEITVTRIRSKANSIFVSFNFAINFLLAMFTLTLILGLGGGDSTTDKVCHDLTNPAHEAACGIEKRGVAFLFIVFAGLSALSVAFVAKFIPETAGRSLEELAVLMGYSDAIKASDSSEDVRMN